MEDKSYIEALMNAPARPEHDQTAQEAAAKRAEEFQAQLKRAQEAMNQFVASIVQMGNAIVQAFRAWLNSPQVRRFLATMKRIINRINPPKYRARQRPLSTRRMMVARRKMLAEIANISQEAGEY